jgi:hypothetical protein
MRTKPIIAAPERALDRLLEALGQELIDASDEEIKQAAKDLRMDLSAKESAAFAGLRYPARPQLADFFDLETPRKKARRKTQGERLRPAK